MIELAQCESESALLGAKGRARQTWQGVDAALGHDSKRSRATGMKSRDNSPGGVSAMARAMGQRLPDVVRRKGVRQLQSLLAAGIEEAECCEQIATNFNVSQRTARNWLAIAYDGMSKEAVIPRAELLGMALRRRRLAMARALKDGDVRTYLAAADSEARLLGLNAAVQTEHHVVLSKVQGMSKAVVEVVRDFFADDPAQRARFVQSLRARLNAQLAERPEKVAVVIDAESEEVAQLEASELASDPRLASAAHGAPSSADPGGASTPA